MQGRFQEWFVPKRGPMWLRALIGMSFWPMTLQCASYPVIGSMLAPSIHWDRVGVIFIVYVLGLGVAAHALDARGANKPWGRYLSDKALLTLAIAALALTVLIGGYYATVYAPLLWFFGILEIFFVFAYNMEKFGGRLHTDLWFAFSWGLLPVLSGFVIQSNTLSLPVLVGGSFGFFTAYIEIQASRPYRALKRKLNNWDTIPVPVGSESTLLEFSRRYELILKSVVACVVVIAITLFAYRVF